MRYAISHTNLRSNKPSFISTPYTVNLPETCLSQTCQCRSKQLKNAVCIWSNLQEPKQQKVQCPKNNGEVMELCMSKYTGPISSSGVYLKILPFKTISWTVARGPMLPSLFASIIATRTRSCDIFCKMDWQGSFNPMATHEPRLTLLYLFLLGSVKNYIYMITIKPWPV
jgi:hypothetical protein